MNPYDDGDTFLEPLAEPTFVGIFFEEGDVEEPEGRYPVLPDCPDCGKAMTPDEAVPCPRCSREHHDECLEPCEFCSDRICVSCSGRGPVVLCEGCAA